VAAEDFQTLVAKPAVRSACKRAVAVTAARLSSNASGNGQVQCNGTRQSFDASDLSTLYTEIQFPPRSKHTTTHYQGEIINAFFFIEIMYV